MRISRQMLSVLVSVNTVRTGYFLRHYHYRMVYLWMDIPGPGLPGNITTRLDKGLDVIEKKGQVSQKRQGQLSTVTRHMESRHLPM
jgi:hypothetical protein